MLCPSLSQIREYIIHHFQSNNCILTVARIVSNLIKTVSVLCALRFCKETKEMNTLRSSAISPCEKHKSSASVSHTYRLWKCCTWSRSRVFWSCAHHTKIGQTALLSSTCFVFSFIIIVIILLLLFFFFLFFLSLKWYFNVLPCVVFLKTYFWADPILSECVLLVPRFSGVVDSWCTVVHPDFVLVKQRQLALCKQPSQQSVKCDLVAKEPSPWKPVLAKPNRSL